MPELKRINLTRDRIGKAKPKASPYRLWDTGVPGLAVRVLKSGTKSFEVHWGTGTKVIGKFPVMTLAAARLQAQTMLVDAAENGTPAGAHKSKNTTLREFVVNKFQPWASANLKWGDGAAERILSVFADFAGKPMASMNAWTLEKWRAKRIKSGVSPNTCNRDLATLKSALHKAVEWKVLDVDPLADVKQTKCDSRRVRYLSGSEDRRLRVALADRDAEGRAARVRANQWRVERGREPLLFLNEGGYCDHLAPAVLVSLNTGLRRGELTALVWADIDFNNKVLTVRAAAAKSGTMRHIPLNVEAEAVLKQWKRQQPEGRLFPFRDFKTAWGKLLDDAKIQDFRWHDLRHDFASKLVMAGVNLNAVRELMGHADLKMTLRYAHLAPSHLAEAVQRLERT